MYKQQVRLFKWGNTINDNENETENEKKKKPGLGLDMNTQNESQYDHGYILKNTLTCISKLL